MLLDFLIIATKSLTSNILYMMAKDKGDRIEYKALLQSEDKYRTIFETTGTATVIIEEDTTISLANKEFEKLSSYTKEEVEDKKSWTDFVAHKDDLDRMMAYHSARRIDPNRAPRNYEYKFIDKHGTVKEVFATLAVIPGTKKSVGSFLDITRAKEMEHLLRIQDKMTSLGRVAAGIAHEIRNPLSGINIYLNTLEKIYDRAESLDKVKQILRQIQSASSKIESVIKRVMDFSKPSEPKLILTDINPPIEEAINLSSATLRKSGIQIEKALAKDLPLCYADPLLIEEVILNLITNATEAMKNVNGDKKIDVTSSVKNDRIIVTVSDSGPGVTPDLKDKIFDPFYSTKNGSTGIGLSINHRIITDHGGSLRVSTSKLGGAEFVIEIPIKESDD
jgi:PAS domain S-box-containing protein